MKTDGNEDTLVYSVPAAGKMLGLSRATSYSIAGKPGGIPVLRFGKRLVVPKAAILKILESAEPKTKA